MLGRGGLGVVYTGLDPELDRRVALKVVRADALVRRPDGPARLVREAQALARLDHPNVVRVYDVGWVDERDPASSVFIAMELVPGCTLREWSFAAPRTWREICAHFLAAGRGLAAVHAAGFVHRDFKPSNVLVSDGPEERVLLADFGLVLLVGRPDDDGVPVSTSWSGSDDAQADPLTRAGALVGTPHYMAPEQRIGRRASPASDQYAFCVSLAEALFGGGSTTASERRSAPVPAATDATRVPRRLRRAVDRGRATATRDRFATMDALLAELEAALAPRSRAVLGWAVAGTGAAIGATALALVGPGASPCADVDDRREDLWGVERKAEIEAALAPTLPAGGSTWPRLARVLDDKADAWAAAFADACTAASPPAVADADDARVACLDDVYAEIEGIILALERPGPQTWVRAMQAAHAIDPSTMCSVDDDLAEPTPRELVQLRALLDVGHYHEAHAAARRLELEHPESPRLQAAAAIALGSAAQADAASGDAESHYERAYWIALEHDGESWAAKAEAQAATSMLHLAWIDGRFDDAQTWRRHAEAAVARARPAPDLEDDLTLEIAGLERNLGRNEIADAMVREVLERVAGRPGSEATWRRALGMHVELLNRRGAYDEALQNAELAVAMARDAFGDEHPATATALYHVAMCHDYAGRKEQTLATLREALRIEDAAFGPAHVQVARTSAMLGHVLLGMGRPEEAAEPLEHARSVLESIFGPDHRETAEILGLLATNAVARGDLEAADALSERELAILREWLPAASDQVVIAKGARAEILLLRRRLAEADALATEAIAGARALSGPYGSNEIEVLNVLLRVWLEQGRAPEVLAESTRAITAIRERGETASRDAALMLFFQGRAHLELFAPKAAAASLLAATEALDRGAIDQPFLSASVQVKLATALAKSGQPTSARKAAQLALAGFRSIEDDTGVAEAQAVLAAL